MTETILLLGGPRDGTEVTVERAPGCIAIGGMQGPYYFPVTCAFGSWERGQISLALFGGAVTSRLDDGRLVYNWSGE